MTTSLPPIIRVVCWRTIESCPLYQTVLLYRIPDLYPVVGFSMTDGDRRVYMLEDGGPEDGDHHKYPSLVYPPTHWMPLDYIEVPEKPE